MKLSPRYKKLTCPLCGAREILTLGFDQMCCACDWDNSLLLVNLGQLDNTFLAALDQFSPNDLSQTDDYASSPKMDATCIDEAESITTELSRGHSEAS